MRFFLTIFIWVVIIGGMLFYSRQREITEAGIRIQDPKIMEVEEVYTLRVTPTFSIEKDPFALQTEGDTTSGVQLRLNGSPLPLPAETLQRGLALELVGIPGLVVGNNEFFLQASPPLAESNLEHGIRVQLLKTGVVAFDQTIWSNQGSLVSGTVHFQMKEEAHKDHDH